MAEMEHDEYMQVWTLTEQSAREFFGMPDNAIVVVLEDKPTDARDIAKYKPEAKLYGVKHAPDPKARQMLRPLTTHELMRIQGFAEEPTERPERDRPHLTLIRGGLE